MKKEFYYNLKNSFKWTDEQFRIVLEDHLETLDILGFIGNTFFEKQMSLEKNKHYIETFAFKHLYQSLDLNHILNGTHFNSRIFNFNTQIFDLPSAYLLQRALLENYLTFYYLYVGPASIEERVCKWNIYEIAGLNARQNLDVQLYESKEKLKNEKNRIIELTRIVKENNYFIALSEENKKKVLKYKPARIKSWPKLFEESDLKNEIFYKAWKLFSNYAHSEYLSLIQFKEYEQNSPELLSTKHLITFTNLTLTAIFIVNIKSLYKEVEENYNCLGENQIECLEFFNAIGKKGS